MRPEVEWPRSETDADGQSVANPGERRKAVAASAEATEHPPASTKLAIDVNDDGPQREPGATPCGGYPIQMNVVAQDLEGCVLVCGAGEWRRSALSEETCVSGTRVPFDHEPAKQRSLGGLP